MKKVFSLKKFIEWAVKSDYLDEIINSLKIGWPIECDGLTQEEMAKKGVSTSDDWMVEIK